jgi:hypothetical protein
MRGILFCCTFIPRVFLELLATIFVNNFVCKGSEAARAAFDDIRHRESSPNSAQLLHADSPELSRRQKRISSLNVMKTNRDTPQQMCTQTERFVKQ